MYKRERERDRQTDSVYVRVSMCICVQSSLFTTTTLGNQNLWPLLTGGRFLEEGLCYKNLNWKLKIVVAVGRWSLFGGGRVQSSLCKTTTLGTKICGRC